MTHDKLPVSQRAKDACAEIAHALGCDAAQFTDHADAAIQVVARFERDLTTPQGDAKERIKAAFLKTQDPTDEDCCIGDSWVCPWPVADALADAIIAACPELSQGPTQRMARILGAEFIPTPPKETSHDD
tara:strand:- start:1936 stop:2325 length:390 start_codon:yes stop_codon:yes gene_type:complete